MEVIGVAACRPMFFQGHRTIIETNSESRCLSAVTVADEVFQDIPIGVRQEQDVEPAATGQLDIDKG